MKINSALTGVLPKIFNRDNVDQRRLGELVDLISDARFTGHGEKKARDVLGEVYEYFLEMFARAEGKRGGEFYTPASVEMRTVTKHNIVKQKSFAERLEDLMRKYTNQNLTAAQIIAELVALAKEVSADASRGATFAPPLNTNELAFYDAVA